jgi:phosphate transport system permease protein
MRRGKNKSNPPADWRELLGGRKWRPGEWLAEKGIFAVSLSAILMIFLIFLFVAREAMPVALGQMNSARTTDVIPPADMGKLSKAELMEYLDLKPAQFAALDKQALQELMQVKVESAAEAPKDKDATVNTTTWRMMLAPYRWSDYTEKERIWQPVSNIHKYNLVPLLLGSLKTTLVALLFAVPLALAAAIYVSQVSSPKIKEWLKPGIEMLSGIPSVVLGFFALVVMATVLQGFFGRISRS